jgi:8-oxo-dGTP diphosphatase
MSELDGLRLELVPHCASVSPAGWDGDHLVRPLTELGHQQAKSLAAALGTNVDAIYSSPALRCLQTVQPLASAAGLPIGKLPELLDTNQFAEPSEWTQGKYQHIAQAVGGGWSAGHGLRALMTMGGRHPGCRVVAASHGDIIPAFLAMLCAAYDDCPLPRVAARGGWYTIRFDSGSASITMNGPDSRRGTAAGSPRCG